mmetsp:Transcript_4890/g.5941  ORF Transcript_4890/g.5941 Transcript_4890/m.5941 type:complete len:146 (-) Transcript_4890:29-466(-)
METNVEKAQPVCYISRKAHFSSAHRLHSQVLSDEENKAIFGKCNHPNGHGHNYIVRVTLRGPVDSKTGMVINLLDLSKAMDSVISELDHKNIDKDVEEFRNGTVSTAENLAIYFFNKLADTIPRSLIYEVKLKETAKNTAIYRGE